MKTLLQSTIFLLLLLSSQQFVKAQDADKTVTLVVSGCGETQEDAKQNALRSAIEQAFGVFISSKTEILNDKLLADEIVSLASGNIQTYTILNESILPDGSWSINLQAIVSVNKLTNFVQSKGYSVQIKGSLFAINIKQQILNEQAEINIMAELVGQLHEQMQNVFNYTITSSEPRSLNNDNNYWEIPLSVNAIANKNMDLCANYLKNTLSSVALSSEEKDNYIKLGKKTYTVIFNYLGLEYKYNLRTISSIKILDVLADNWEFYNRLFVVEDGIKQAVGIGEGIIYEFRGDIDYWDRNAISIKINFLSEGQQSAFFKWADKKTLQQLEATTEYKVSSPGTVSFFRHGGFIVSEELRLVCSLFDLGKFNLLEADSICNELRINSYDDWRLPALNELVMLQDSLSNNKIGGFNNLTEQADNDFYYWSGQENNNGEFYILNMRNGEFEGSTYESNKLRVRAVRNYDIDNTTTLKKSFSFQSMADWTQGKYKTTFFAGIASPKTKAPISEGSKSEIFTVVETMPEFTGGQSKLSEYLASNIKYPAMARENGISGTVHVSFVIEDNGSLSNITALNRLGGGLTEEALRVVKMMPNWTPGKQNGKVVRVQCTFPINFKLR